MMQLLAPSRFLVVAPLLVCLATTAAAQEITLEARQGSPAVRVLEEVLQRGEYLLLSRDTVLSPEFRAPGDLVVWDALVRLEGSVGGAAVAINGTLVLRPGARVEGPVASLGALILPSHLAEHGPIVELPPDQRVEVSAEAGRLHVAVAPPPPLPRFGLGGLFGFYRMAYDRVDALSVSWGPQWRPTGQEFGPTIEGWLTVRTVRAPGGGVRAGLPAGRLLATVQVERATVTNEWWIRSDLANSAEALVLGRDLRDYHESDRAWLRLSRAPPPAGETGALHLMPWVSLTRSTDRSLRTRAPWALLGRGQLERVNPPVAEMTLLSVDGGVGVDWIGAGSSFQGGIGAEYGVPQNDEPAFSRMSASGEWTMQALWNHSLAVRGHAFGTLTGDGAPPQRWSFLGGQGTLPTLPVAALRGDNLVLIASQYRVPLELVQLPLLGSPALELLHATGTAWRTGESMPAWEQNLGAGLAFSLARVRAWIDPAIDRPRPTLLVEFAAP
jgi:hypothetical protein